MQSFVEKLQRRSKMCKPTEVLQVKQLPNFIAAAQEEIENLTSVRIENQWIPVEDLTIGQVVHIRSRCRGNAADWMDPEKQVQVNIELFLLGIRRAEEIIAKTQAVCDVPFLGDEVNQVTSLIQFSNSAFGVLYKPTGKVYPVPPNTVYDEVFEREWNSLKSQLTNTGVVT